MGDSREPSDDLERLSAELLERLSRDDVGPPAKSGSHVVGRLVRAGSALENLLRAVVIHAAAVEECSPDALLTPVGGKKPDLQRSMAGPLAHGLKRYFLNRPSNSIPVRIGPIVDDLLEKHSTILGFIAVRNDVAKDDGDPGTGADATNALKGTIAEFRRRAGWK